MLDAKVLAACLDSRQAYERVRDHIHEEELSPQARAWWPLIRAWYDRDTSAKSVDRSLLRGQGSRTFPQKHAETLVGWFDDLGEVESPGNAAYELLEMKRQVAWAELQQLMHSGASREKVLAAARRHTELMELQELRGSEERRSTDPMDMFRLQDPSHKIRLHPKTLNERAGGGAVPGDHILIFGRTESGKTLFAVSLVAGLLKDGYRVIYICNEEDYRKTQLRILTSLLRCTPAQAQAHPEKAVAAAQKRGFANLDIRHLTPGTVEEIDERLDEVKPDVLVIDQIRNLASSGEKLTQKLETTATKVRSMLARHQVVGISVTQANDRTERHGQEPPIWLQTSDIDSSRTGLPGQCDLIVGVGANEELKAHGQRAISLPKNKLGQSHEGFMVSVDTLRSIVS